MKHKSLNQKTLAGILAGIIILGLVYVGNFPVSSELENEVIDYLGITIQAATTSGITLSATVASVLSISVDSNNVDLGNLIPGTPSLNGSTTVSLNGNNATGYNLKVNRNNNPTSTLTLNGDLNATNTIPDYTPTWNSELETSTSTPGATLSFRVILAGSTENCFSVFWWGWDFAPKWAGFPTTVNDPTNTFRCMSYQSATTTAKHHYRLDAPSNQYPGNYSGGIIYTATSNP